MVSIQLKNNAKIDFSSIQCIRYSFLGPLELRRLIILLIEALKLIFIEVLKVSLGEFLIVLLVGFGYKNHQLCTSRVMGNLGLILPLLIGAAASVVAAITVRMGSLTEVLDGAWPQILANGDGEVISVWEDLELSTLLLSIDLSLGHLVLLILSLSGADESLLCLSLDGHLVADTAANEAEEVEERGSSAALELVRHGFLDGLEVLVRLFGFEKLDGEVGKTIGDILALLPVNLDWLRDKAGPSVGVAAVPELLLELGVVEPLVVLELKGDLDGADVTAVNDLAVNDLKVLNVDVLERGGENLRVGWRDELVDIWWGRLKDEGPEVIDLCDGLGALLVDWSSQNDLLAD